MKTFLVIIILSAIFSIESLLAVPTVTVKVKDNCVTATNKKCTVGSSGGISISVADMKNKAQSLISEFYPDDLNVNNFRVLNDFFIPNPENCEIGIGVINGLMYFPNNPLDTYYYWLYDTSTQYSTYNDWKNAFELIHGSGSAPESCSTTN